jgi:hypothetical protein
MDGADAARRLEDLEAVFGAPTSKSRRHMLMVPHVRGGDPGLRGPRGGADPTTAFVARDGQVRWLHSGFSGPATGRSTSG